MNCYILVGGRSRRMGEPKAALRFGESTFLDLVAGAAGPVFERVVAVQRRGGETLLPDTIFEAPHEDEAAIFGVAAALADARERCFVLALDYPLITAQLLRYLRERFEATNRPMLAPRWDGVVQTLCAGYAPAISQSIDAAIAQRRYDLQSIARAAEIVGELEIRDGFEGEPLMNVNTAEDLGRAWNHRDTERKR